MRIIRSATGFPVRVLSSALSYTLLIALVAPFHARTATATTVTAASHDAASVSPPDVSIGGAHASEQAPRQDNEILVRFGEHVTEQEQHDDAVRPWMTGAGTHAALFDGTRRDAGFAGKVFAGGVANAAGALGAWQNPINPPPGRGGIDQSGGNGDGGNGGGNGIGNGNGGQSPRTVPPPRAHGANPDGGFSVAPPVPKTDGSANMPNIDDVSHLKSHVPTPLARQISPNNVCADCDPGGGGGGGYEPPGDRRYATPRTLPQNETGQAGVDLGSRNFNWGVPIVGLPGRAGLDLGLALTYNSLLWTKQAPGIKYNADRGFPGPGFRLGFPTIQQQYWNSQVGVYAYMMVTPGGGRVEMRQMGGSNVYESADGSYTQMIDYGNGTALVRTTDGTQLSFASINGEMRCTQIKDRNGNYISVVYDGNGHLTTVTDTLGRTVNFNYDGNQNLSSITQGRNGATHTWASFSYGQVYIQPNFPGLSINGPNYTNQTVLTRVWLHDGTYYDFDYTSWGQVWRIRNYAPDNQMLNYTAYNLPQDTGAQSDCPRFTERRDWVLWGVMNASQEVVTTYSVAGDGTWSQVTTPDGVTYLELFHTTGWQTGLTYQSEVWSGGERRKWTTTAWTQDDTSLPYQQNPRPYDISIYDEAGNRRRKDITYASYSLPIEVREYSTDGSGYGGFLRRTYVNYRWDQAFTDRRIIGLTQAVTVVNENNQIAAKTDMHYDWGADYQSSQAPSVQHDTANYPASFVLGRGNLIAVRRFNVYAPDDDDQAVWLEINGYNLAGSRVFIMDNLWRQTKFSYGDSFSDGNNSRNALAYPTTITDADNFSSAVQYNYDTGAVTWSQDPKGAVETRNYYPDGRVERVTNQTNSAYTRWVYPAAHHYAVSYATVQAGAGEVFSAQYNDGAGRVRAVQTDLPNSTGGYSAVHYMSDVMGRRVYQSSPTEINSGWSPTGDDAADGWRWTQQAYDWQGRPTVTTNPDGSTTETSYSGCGCAGNEQVTTRDERGRRKRYTRDTLGRLVRTEELNWDTSVYATAYQSYNARDQLTQINHQGQIRTMEYDGHGRLSRRTTPEQGATTYAYNLDDTLSQTVDARGASSTFSYNGRHLVTGINYGVPAGVAPTSNVSFGYDSAGNRTSMTDGLGSVTYSYDTLSRLQWEERTFNGVGTYRLSYTYNLAGQLTSITNPWNVQVGYQYDHTGQLRGVTGAGYAGVTSYASNLQYRASGALKAMTYGNGKQLSMNYDTRQRLSRWHVAGVTGSDYAYNYAGWPVSENTGRVVFAANLYDQTLDKSYEYDQVGRLIVGHTGVEARSHNTGQSQSGSLGSYSHHYGYDVYGNLTQRAGWGGWNAQDTATYTNNRRAGLPHDAAGNLTTDGYTSFTYDARGLEATDVSPQGSLQHAYDGDGWRAKKVENGVAGYRVRSSVLGGQVVAELDGSGQWGRGYVYVGGQLLAQQHGNGVWWEHVDPVTKSRRSTGAAGQIVATVVELDPWGGESSSYGESWRHGVRYTTYERDVSGWNEAGVRRYSSWTSRFAQPDPSDASYNLGDLQSFNRYAYVGNDPVNKIDPTGLLAMDPGYTLSWRSMELDGGRGSWDRFTAGWDGWGGFGDTGRRGPGDLNDGGSGGPQNPAPDRRSEEQRNCDNKLSSIFGGVAAGSGYEPTGLPSVGGSYRGGPNGHLNNAAHIYGSGNGFGEADLYIPAGGTYIGRNPHSNEDSHMFYYSQLGSARNVTLFTAHVANFSAPRGETTGRTNIGDIGGRGGRSITPVGVQNPSGRGTNIHAHLAIHQNTRGKPRGYTGNRLSFYDVFCK